MIHDHKSIIAAGAYRDATADRVRRFLPMVRRQAWHLHGGGRQGIELEDLMQAGLLALTEAAQRHAGPGEDGFAAYAKLRVRGAMVDLIRRAVPLSRGGMERARRIAAEERRLTGLLGRPPGEAELAAALGISLDALSTLRDDARQPQLESLDEAYCDHDAAFADPQPDSLDLLARAELRQAVAAAIAELPQRLALIMQLYFVEELNLAEIAATLDVSVPRVHQLKAQALDRLRTHLGAFAEIA